MPFIVLDSNLPDLISSDRRSLLVNIFSYFSVKTYFLGTH